MNRNQQYGNRAMSKFFLNFCVVKKASTPFVSCLSFQYIESSKHLSEVETKKSNGATQWPPSVNRLAVLVNRLQINQKEQR